MGELIMMRSAASLTLLLLCVCVCADTDTQQEGTAPDSAISSADTGSAEFVEHAPITEAATNGDPAGPTTKLTQQRIVRNVYERKKKKENASKKELKFKTNERKFKEQTWSEFRRRNS